MPKMDGYMLREAINNNDSLSLSATPYLFLTTANAMEGINKGYRLNIQGHFTKPGTFEGIVDMPLKYFGACCIT